MQGMRGGVIISDYRLAHGVLGTDVLRRLLAAAAGATGLLITGDIAASELQAIRESGFPLLHKPVHYRELKVLLRSAGSPESGAQQR
jgi:DNA-binding NtrC family response regulator